MSLIFFALRFIGEESVPSMLRIVEKLISRTLVRYPGLEYVENDYVGWSSSI